MFSEYIVLLFSLIGFLISFYIWHRKRNKKELLCFFKEKKCSSVIESRYSKVLKIDNSTAGLLYYGLIFATYSLSIFFSITIFSLVNIFISISSLFAALFSIYLLFVQAFILKIWCEWCTLSIACSIVIFVFVMI